MKTLCPRLVVRALILHEDRLLLVNAWGGGRRICGAPPVAGGTQQLARQPDPRSAYEETGLTVAVGAPCLVNEFHDPKGSFHQVDLYFHCTILAGRLDATWRDPEGVVTERRFFSRAELSAIRFKPDSLPAAAWGEGILYDPLEPIARMKREPEDAI